jgi:hypothetical protein
MKVIIAGSRSIVEYKHIGDAVIDSGFNITEVVSGAARGVDTLGERWAEVNNIQATRFPADWDKYGKIAGPVRNEQMAKYADALIAIWDGFSRGTKNMIDLARKYKLQTYIKIVEPNGKKETIDTNNSIQASKNNKDRMYEMRKEARIQRLF